MRFLILSLFCHVAYAAQTILYSSGGLYDGLLGNRSATTQYCEEQSQYIAFQCSAAKAFIGYTIELFNWYTPSGVNIAHPVVGTNGITVASNWTNLFMVDNLANSFSNAGVLNGTEWWSGIGKNGETKFNCLDWTSNANDQCILGEYGNGARTNKAWVNAGHRDCGGLNQLVCICSDGVFTLSPSSSPSQSPWLPTEEPSASPGV